MVETPNVSLHIIEGTFGDRHHELKNLCEELGVDYFSVPIKQEIWIKENLLNIMMRRVIVQFDANYLGWFDADIHFRNPEWAIESIHQLQHYAVIQPFSDAVHLTFEGGIHKHHKSFGYYSAKGIPQSPKANNPYCHPYGHTGFAWCCTREWFENCGLLDFAILGSGDAHMAYGCIGQVQGTINQQVAEGYKHLANLWQDRAVLASDCIVGYTPGRLEHGFHGPLERSRKYASRWKILVKYQYDPMKDIRFDHEGVVHLIGKRGLAHAIRRYNRNRIEDSIENT